MHAIHGHAHAGRRSPTYKSWDSMIQRCTQASSGNYEVYGGRGITFCARWRKFVNFLADMGARPVGKTLDRKNTNGNYTPKNCRWAIPREQCASRRTTKLKPEHVEEILALSKVISLTAIAGQYGVTATHVCGIVNQPRQYKRYVQESLRALKTN